MIDTMRAYWALAMQRFIDEVCMAIDRIFVRALPERVDEVIRASCMDDEILLKMFEVDPGQERQRALLENKRKRLEAAIAQMRHTGPGIRSPL